MFTKPRIKKSILPPPSKKRKTASDIEEITFDNDARHEFLTGFQKRKQQRIKNAQEQAAKKARQERIETRKQIREERRREVEEHVQTVNKMLREAAAASGDIDQDFEDESSEEWDGFPDQPNLDLVDHEEEYIDEDRYTMVTVESVAVSRDGLYKPQIDSDEDEEGCDKSKSDQIEEDNKKGPNHPPKKKKKKFRYENKIERQLTERKRKLKNRRHG